MDMLIRYTFAAIPWTPLMLLAYWSSKGLPAREACIFALLAFVAAHLFVPLATDAERYRLTRPMTLARALSLLTFHCFILPVVMLIAVFLLQRPIVLLAELIAASAGGLVAFIWGTAILATLASLRTLRRLTLLKHTALTKEPSHERQPHE